MAAFGNLDKHGKIAIQALLSNKAPVTPCKKGLSYWRRHTAKGQAFCKDARTTGTTTANIGKHFSTEVWGSDTFAVKRTELEAEYAIALAAYQQRHDVHGKCKGVGPAKKARTAVVPSAFSKGYSEWCESPEGMAFKAPHREAGTASASGTHYLKNVWLNAGFALRRKELVAEFKAVTALHAQHAK